MKRDWTLEIFYAATQAVFMLLWLFGATLMVLGAMLALFALLGGNP